jgi:hypothetical protein
MALRQWSEKRLMPLSQPFLLSVWDARFWKYDGCSRGASLGGPTGHARAAIDIEVSLPFSCDSARHYAANSSMHPT